jgi:hypothetical protein
MSWVQSVWQGYGAVKNQENQDVQDIFKTANAEIQEPQDDRKIEFKSQARALEEKTRERQD